MEYARMKKSLLFIAAAAVFLLIGCSAGDAQKAQYISETQGVNAAGAMASENGMTVRSSGIADGVMDPKYGIKGEVNAKGTPVVSPPLTTQNAPEGTASFAVYMDDPDAKPLAGHNWVHWMAVNIPAGDIPEDFSRNSGGKAVQGKNDFGEIGYGGPTPPDKDHTYVITVYALDDDLPLKEGFSKAEFEQAIKGHVLASAAVQGLYKK